MQLAVYISILETNQQKFVSDKIVHDEIVVRNIIGRHLKSNSIIKVFYVLFHLLSFINFTLYFWISLFIFSLCLYLYSFLNLSLVSPSISFYPISLSFPSLLSLFPFCSSFFTLFYFLFSHFQTMTKSCRFEKNGWLYSGGTLCDTVKEEQDLRHSYTQETTIDSVYVWLNWYS